MARHDIPIVMLQPPHAALRLEHFMIDCPFCGIQARRIVAENALAAAIRDAFPISPGHTLIVPKRHVGSWFESTAEERSAMLELLDAQKQELDSAHKPGSYNIGINDGPAAGQTIAHLHMHLIPRYSGDVPDPRGGVRWVIPAKADYWSAP